MSDSSAFKNNPYIFSFSYMGLHILTYSIYFLIIHHQLPIREWFIGACDIRHIFWFHGTFCINLAGIFLLYSFFVRKKMKVILFFYFLFLYIEQAHMTVDVGESFEEISLIKVAYYIFMSKFYFPNGKILKVFHLSFLLSLIHLGIIFFRTRLKKYANQG